MIRFFDSASSLAEEYQRLCKGSTYTSHSDLQWFGDETNDQSLSRAVTGDISLVPEAEALLSQLDNSIATQRRSVVAVPAGGWPSVGDALAGRPLAMRRIIHDTNENAPITILVMGVSSSAIRADVLHKRGIVILALVMALARSRPVILKQVATMHGVDTGETIFVTHINTAPLDLANACWVLSSQGFMRRMNYALAERLNGFNGGWPRNYNYGRADTYVKYIGQTFGSGEANTLVIKAAEMHDVMLTQPVKWINDQIKAFSAAQELEEQNYA